MRYCSVCNKEKENSYCESCKKDTGNRFVMNVSVGVYKTRLHSISMTHKRPGIKDFLKRVYTGWKISGDLIKHPDGVTVDRVIDKENNRYDEVVKDNNTSEIVREIHEPLDKHIPSAQKKKIK